MLKNWLEVFLYHIKNNKFFTALNILGLSMGIAAVIFSILYWNNEHSYNAWNPEKEKVFQVILDRGKNTDNPYGIEQTLPLASFLNEMPEVETHCFFDTWNKNEIIAYKGKKELVTKIQDAQSNFFTFFPFEFVKGNADTAIQDDNCIALSDETAKRLFGSGEALGKQVQYQGKTLTVRGVYHIPGESSFAPMAVTNIDMSGEYLKGIANDWNYWVRGLLVKLRDPLKAPAVKKKIEGLYFENDTKAKAKILGISLKELEKKEGKLKILMEPLVTARLHSVTDGYPEGKGNYQFLVIMVGLSVLILVLSIVNYVNLATANAVKRAKEVGVRKILGASKGNIIRQFIFETILMTTFSILFALVLVELSLPYYNDFLNKQLVLNSNLLHLQLLLIFIVVVVLAGILPAVYISDFEVLKILKSNFTRSKSGIWLRNAMLVLQFAIASFFIVGSYIVYQQISYISNKDLGFKGEQVLQISYNSIYNHDDKDYRQKVIVRYNTVKQELLKIKGVEQVSTASFIFGEGGNSTTLSYKDIDIMPQNVAVDFGMMELLKMKMAKGRYFSDQFSSDTISSVIVNEVTAKMINEKDPIGKEIIWGGKELKIIGVLKDFHLYGPQQEIPPMAFVHYKTIEWMARTNMIYVKVNPDNMEQAIAAIEKFWTGKVDTAYPFTYDFVDKNFARTYEEYVKQKNLFSLLNIVVILIALFGLFALASYSIERRMKEIAIRKTLGAGTKALLRSLSGQYVVFCIIGFLIALFPVYFLLNKWLENFVYRIELSFLPFVIGFIVLMLLVLVVVLLRAYQATRADVLKYLKYE